jgi:hypothetical protein
VLTDAFGNSCLYLIVTNSLGLVLTSAAAAGRMVREHKTSKQQNAIDLV